MKVSRRAKRLAEAAGFALLAGVVRALPHGAALRVGAATGRFAFAIGVRRKVAVGNVEERLGPPGGRRAAERIARESYEVAGRTFACLLRADRIPPDALSRIAGTDVLHGLIAGIRDSGAVLVSGHFGNWELLVLAIRRAGVPVSSMAGDQANDTVDAAIRRIRTRADTPPLSSRSGLRNALRLLRARGIVATLMDQDARGKGAFVQFLGAPASAHVGVVSLAMRAGVPVVPGVLVDEDGAFRFVPGTVWRPDPARTDAENQREGAAHFHRFLEAQVRAHPGNYFWAHRRWKTRPRADEDAAAAGAVS